MIRIDLHTHSTASDGTTAPADLVRAAAATGLDVVALTDHDTTSGWQPALEALPRGLTLIRGAELSCRWFDRNGWPISLHLLAYLFDPAEPAFAAERARITRSRLTRAERLVRLLTDDGVPITWDGVLGIAAGAPVGRPHIAQALVAAGVVDDVPAAFDARWLGRRYRVPKQDADVFDALRLIRGAGGVAVFAHPKAVSRGRIVPDRLLVELAGAGLAGLEVDHPDHDEAARAALRGLAADLDLVMTGSSDFHGTNKTVPLGAHLTEVDAYERLVDEATGAEPVAA